MSQVGGSVKPEGCFVIGSGPSLNAVDVKRLRNFRTIAYNHSYVAYADWGFWPTFYASFDMVVVEDNREELREMIASPDCGIKRFFLNAEAARLGFINDARLQLVRLLPQRKFIASLQEIGDFGNVGASSIQVLAALGYKRLVMVGVDGRYTGVKVAAARSEAKIIVAKDDGDHFSSAYGAGKHRLANVDLTKILGGWPDLAAGAREFGIDIRNASPGSALKEFPAIQFSEALDWLV